MFCPNCGKSNENENKFCKFCGHDLRTAPSSIATTPVTPPTPVTPVTTPVTQTTPVADTHRNIYNNPYNRPPVHSNIDLGYLIIAILVVINIFIWMVWNVSSSNISGNDYQSVYKLVRVLSTIISIAQFIVMLIFAKKAVYKVLIGLIAAFVILYDLYYLVQSFSLSRY